MAPLGLMSTGERAEIVEIREKKDHCHDKRESHICHVEDMGLRIGKTVEVLNNEGRGPLLLKVDESRIAIGRGIAMKILVRRIKG